MSVASLLQSLQTDIKPPERFPSPFNNQPHALAIVAAEHLQTRLPQLTANHDFFQQQGGKMLGVLVVRDAHGKTGYLSAFSGMLGGSWLLEYFAEPLFAHETYQRILDQGQQQLDSIERQRLLIAESTGYRQAQIKLQQVTVNTDRAIQENKRENAINKEQRRLMREANAGNLELLKQLDEQSRTDKRQRQQLQRETKMQLQGAKKALEPFSASLQVLSQRRKGLSAKLQRRLFDEYTIRSVAVAPVKLRSLFKDKLPPGGAGDCAAVKLLNAAIHHSLTPLCIAEFWWGSDSGLRQHGRFYPACRSKCRPILPHMLHGLDVAPARYECIDRFSSDQPGLVFEDSYIVVVNKPAGMLSVPGQAITDSVETRLREKYPHAGNKTLLLHRLDQATSGLLVAAKDAATYKHLQRQFQERTVFKRYIARIAATGIAGRGEIRLPLRVDLEDRPRQLVCHQYGREALTRYRVIATEANSSVVEFLPVTGRTHQLRIHAAHPDGLNAPIVGDELYGKCADRLHLHAHTLSFTHPLNGKQLSFSVTTPFYSDDTNA